MLKAGDNVRYVGPRGNDTSRGRPDTCIVNRINGSQLYYDEGHSCDISYWKLNKDKQSSFKAGDKVRCLTDKYKMINLNEIYTIESIRENSWIHLAGVSHNYREKYFVNSTLPEKEAPMPKEANLKNPFKFMSEKPEWKELQTLIEKNYSNVVVPKRNTTQVNQLLLFALSLAEDFKEAGRQLTSSVEISKIVDKTEAKMNLDLDYYNNLVEYGDHIKVSAIAKELYFMFLASDLNNYKFKSVFDIDLPLACQADHSKVDGSKAYKIYYKERIMENFDEYVTISSNNSSTTVPVSSKEVMENIIFTSILEGVDQIPRFHIGVKLPDEECEVAT